jgi:cation diffusion facilitator family transporter
MTDVWTSAGVLGAIGLVAATGWNILDPLIALGVAIQIVWTGVQLMRRSALGLLDTALSAPELAAVRQVLAVHEGPEVRFHAVLTRMAGARRFVSMHVLVPGDWTVRRGHDLLERIEQDIHAAIPQATVLTHLEAIEDPASYADEALDRSAETAVPEPTTGE